MKPPGLGLALGLGVTQAGTLNAQVRAARSPAYAVHVGECTPRRHPVLRMRTQTNYVLGLGTLPVKSGAPGSSKGLRQSFKGSGCLGDILGSETWTQGDGDLFARAGANSCYRAKNMVPGLSSLQGSLEVLCTGTPQFLPVVN